MIPSREKEYPMSTPPPTPPHDTTNSVDLAPGDRARATWRPRGVSPAPSAAAFDLSSARARLRRVTAGAHFYAPFDWSRVALPPRLAPRAAAVRILAQPES